MYVPDICGNILNLNGRFYVLFPATYTIFRALACFSSCRGVRLLPRKSRFVIISMKNVQSNCILYFLFLTSWGAWLRRATQQPPSTLSNLVHQYLLQKGATSEDPSCMCRIFMGATSEDQSCPCRFFRGATSEDLNHVQYCRNAS